jgi:hypothetical protein
MDIIESATDISCSAGNVSGQSNSGEIFDAMSQDFILYLAEKERLEEVRIAMERKEKELKEKEESISRQIERMNTTMHIKTRDIQNLIDQLDKDKKELKYLLERKRISWVVRHLRTKMWPKRKEPEDRSSINIAQQFLDEEPLELCCPITIEIMKDPVIASDGHTYERSAIEDWFRTKRRSPVTNLEIPSTLIPNYAMRKLVTSYAR